MVSGTELAETRLEKRLVDHQGQASEDQADHGRGHDRLHHGSLLNRVTSSLNLVLGPAFEIITRPGPRPRSLSNGQSFATGFLPTIDGCLCRLAVAQVLGQLQVIVEVRFEDRLAVCITRSRTAASVRAQRLPSTAYRITRTQIPTNKMPAMSNMFATPWSANYAVWFSPTRSASHSRAWKNAKAIPMPSKFPCPYKHCIKANYVREFVSYLLSTVTNQSWKELLSLMHMKCPMNSRVRTGNRVKITNRSLPTFCQMLIPCK